MKQAFLEIRIRYLWISYRGIFLRNPAKKLNGGKNKFEFFVVKFKFNFPTIGKLFLAGFLEKFAFNIPTSINLGVLKSFSETYK